MSKTDIFQIVRLNERKQFEIWLSNASDVSVLNGDKENLLQTSIAYKGTEIGLRLLEHDIDINNQNKVGQTPLHYASEHMNLKVVMAILSKPDLKINLRDSYGNAPIWTAVFNARGNYEIVKLLIQNGADPNVKNNHDRSALDFARQIKDEKLIRILS